MENNTNNQPPQPIPQQPPQPIPQQPPQPIPQQPPQPIPQQPPQPIPQQPPQPIPQQPPQPIPQQPPQPIPQQPPQPIPQQPPQPIPQQPPQPIPQQPPQQPPQPIPQQPPQPIPQQPPQPIPQQPPQPIPQQPPQPIPQQPPQPIPQQPPQPIPQQPPQPIPQQPHQPIPQQPPQPIPQQPPQPIPQQPPQPIPQQPPQPIPQQPPLPIPQQPTQPIQEPNQEPTQQPTKLKQKQKPKAINKKMILIISVVVVVVAIGAGVFFNSLSKVDIIAEEMRLQKVTGDVVLQNSGTKKEVVEGSRLITKDNVTTQISSDAYILLDLTKSVRVDELSEIEINQTDKNYRVDLNSGTLFFNVTQNLNEDETLNFHTNNVVTGVRGTSGIITYDTDKKITQIAVLTGSVVASSISGNSEDGEVKAIEAGEIGIVTTNLDGSVTFEIISIEDDEPAFFFNDNFIDNIQNDLNNEGNSFNLSEELRNKYDENILLNDITPSNEDIMLTATIKQITEGYTSIEYVGEDIFKAQIENGNWGLIDIDSNPITDFIYKDFDIFSDGYIIYHTQEFDPEVRGHVGETREVEIDKYEFWQQIRDEALEEDKILLNPISNAGYMNTKGEIILELYKDHFDLGTEGLNSFNNGLAYVSVSCEYEEIEVEIESSNTSTTSGGYNWIANGGGGSKMYKKAAYINTDFVVETFTEYHSYQFFDTVGGFSADGLYNFEYEWDFYNGYAVVYTTDNEYAVIDTTRNVVMVLEDALSVTKPGFDEGILIYQNQDSKFGAIDTNGDIIIDFKYDFISVFNEGLASVIKDNKLGYINTKGELITEIIYDKAYRFNYGYAHVGIENKWGLVNSNGDEVTPINFDRIESLNSNFAIVGFGEYTHHDGGSSTGFDGVYGLVSTQTGDMLIDAQYDTMDYIERNLFIISKDEKYGIIDVSGNEILPIEYDEIVYNVNFIDIATAIKGSECYVIELK